MKEPIPREVNVNYANYVDYVRNDVLIYVDVDSDNDVDGI